MARAATWLVASARVAAVCLAGVGVALFVGATPAGATWPGASGNLVVGAPSGVWVMSPGGRLLRRLPVPGDPASVQVSRDGNSFLVSSGGRVASGDVATFLVRSGKAIELVPDASDAVWTPNTGGF